MYKTITTENLEKIKNQLSNHAELWLEQEIIDYLDENVDQKDIQIIKDTLYQDFLRRNPNIKFFG